MQSLKKYYFGKQKLKPNTFIGGIGGTINTSALLASKLGISESRIKLFKVTGVDVECAIVGGSYSIPSSAFLGNMDITFYADNSGLVSLVNQGAFRNATNIKFCIFQNATQFIGSGSGNGCFRNCANLRYVKAPKVISLTGDWVFDSCPKLESVDYPLLQSAGGYSFRNNYSLKKIKAPSLQSVLYTSFAGCTSVDYIAIPICTNLGGTVLNEDVFNGIGSGCRIIVHQSLQTINAGSPDGDISYALARGAIIRYVANYTSPSPVTDLSVGTVYNAAIQLNFTPPAGSTNAVDFYEVYLNNSPIPQGEITSSGQFITGLTPLTIYNITLVAVDIFYNKSMVSNVVNASTNTIDADPYLYINASSTQAFEIPIVNLFTSLKSNNIN